jgi:hypothetical protein
MSLNATGHPLIEAFSGGDARAVRRAMARDAVFHTPVADYRGHDQIAPVPTHPSAPRNGKRGLHGDDTETVCFFTA